eukprot:scaffold115001_cov69-Phaeocystis_antarctica.AAC.3
MSGKARGEGAECGGRAVERVVPRVRGGELGGTLVGREPLGGVALASAQADANVGRVGQRAVDRREVQLLVRKVGEARGGHDGVHHRARQLGGDAPQLVRELERLLDAEEPGDVRRRHLADRVAQREGGCVAPVAPQVGVEDVDERRDQGRDGRLVVAALGREEVLEAAAEELLQGRVCHDKQGVLAAALRAGACVRAIAPQAAHEGDVLSTVRSGDAE